MITQTAIPVHGPGLWELGKPPPAATESPPGPWEYLLQVCVHAGVIGLVALAGGGSTRGGGIK